MDIITTKWIVLSVLFVLTFLFSMLPLKFLPIIRNTSHQQQHERYQNIVSILSCFAAGVFMGTGLLDLLPDVNEALSQANINKYVKSSFPVAEFTVAFGFFIVLIFEQIVKEYKEGFSSSYSGGETIERRNRIRSENASVPTEQRDGNNVEEASDSSGPELHSTLRTIALLLALSLHSIFEGIAIGLQPDTSSVVQICAAVIFHKVIIAFSLGLNLVQTNLTFGSIIKSNFLFSVTSPIGMGIAIAVEVFGQSVNSSIVNGILQGLACGTFVYVTFFEILPHELHNTSNRLLKLLALIAGFSAVCLVLLLDPSELDKCYRQ